MKRASALQRKTELRRGAPMRRAGLEPARSAPARKSLKNTGPSHKTRGLVLARDNWQCVACGKPVGGAFTWWSLQHRLARGQGGGNSPSNLIVLCGSATSPGCHRQAEDRDPQAHARGYYVESWQNPATTPIYLVRDEPRWVLATDDGTYIDTDAPEGIAA